MKKIRSMFRQFGSLVLITGLLLGAGAVRAVFASFDAGSALFAQQKAVPGALPSQGSTGEASATAPAGADATPGSPEQESEIRGEVTSLDGEALVVNGILIHTNSATEIDPGIVTGSIVKVEGSLQPDGSVLAREVKIARARSTASPTEDPTLQATPGADDDGEVEDGGLDDGQAHQPIPAPSSTLLPSTVHESPSAPENTPGGDHHSDGGGQGGSGGGSGGGGDEGGRHH